MQQQEKFGKRNGGTRDWRCYLEAYLEPNCEQRTPVAGYSTFSLPLSRRVANTQGLGSARGTQADAGWRAVSRADSPPLSVALTKSHLFFAPHQCLTCACVSICSSILRTRATASNLAFRFDFIYRHILVSSTFLCTIIDHGCSFKSSAFL